MVEAALREVMQTLPGPFQRVSQAFPYPLLPSVLAVTSSSFLVSSNGPLELRSLSDGSVQHTYNTDPLVKPIAVSQDQSLCLCASTQYLYVLNLSSPAIESHLTLTDNSKFACFALNDGYCMLQSDFQMSLLQLPALRHVCTVSLSGQNSIIASGPNYVVTGAKGELIVWTLQEAPPNIPLLEQGDPKMAMLLRHQWTKNISTEITALFTHKNRFFVGLNDGSIGIWTVIDDQNVSLYCTLRGYPGPVKGMEMTFDETYLLVKNFVPTRNNLQRASFLSIWNVKERTELGLYPLRPFTTLIPNTYSVLSVFEEEVTVRSLDLYFAPLRDDHGADISGDINALVKGGERSDLAFLRFPGNFNSLHVCVHFRRNKLLKIYLEMGVPALKSSWGSPLRLAIDENNDIAVAVILKHLEEVAKTQTYDEALRAFYPYAEDLEVLMPKLLKDVTTLMIPFFSILLCKLPSTRSAEASNLFSLQVSYSDVQDPDETALIEEIKEHFGFFDNIQELEFHVSLLPISVTAGSTQSVELLESLSQCSHRKVLNTPFIASLIRGKWAYYYPITMFMTCVFVLTVANFIILQFVELGNEWVFRVSFMILLAICFMYERFQMLSEKLNYLLDPMNYIDFGRLTLSVMWVLRALLGREEVRGLTFAVAALTLLRGFTHFRTFALTRKYVYVTRAVVGESYTFLVVLGYSACSFGILRAILLGSDFTDAMSNALSFTIGGYERKNANAWLWGLFLVTVFVNIIVMMNLLISILRDAIVKVGLTLEENDLYLQLSLILEYEHMMPDVESQANYMRTARVMKPVAEQDKILQRLEQLAKDNVSVQSQLQSLQDDMSLLKSHLLKS